MSSQIRNLTRASRQSSRVRTGEDRIPAVWRGRVVLVRETASASGSPAGVYVTVPRLTGDEIHGPLPWVGAQPVDGDRVLLAAIEGRKTDMVILNPTGADTELRGRVDALGAQLEVLDTYVEHYITARMGAIEWDVEQLENLVTSRHGETVNAIGILEAQMEVLDSIVAAHQLGTVTWWTGALPTDASNQTVPIPGYSPSGVARQGRVEVDVVLEDLRGFSRMWCRPMIDGDALATASQDIDPAGETHRFRYRFDIQVPANATVEVQYAVLGGDGNRGPGRIGVTRPVLTSVTERSA